MPISFQTPELQTNESLKSFESPDSLATSYLELKGKVDTGSIDLLPEEMRKDPAIAVFKNVSELGKGYVETKKMVGGIDKAPEKPDAYKFTPLANLHPNLKTEGIQNAFKGIFHKAGMGNKSADIVQQEVLGVLSQGMAQQQKAKEELAAKNETALRSEWGQDFDKKFDMVVKTLTRAGGKEALSDVEGVAKAMKGSPVLLRSLGNIFSLLSEDSIGKLGEPADKPITGSDEAKEAINKLNAEILAAGTKHPYYDERHPDHMATKKKMTDLFNLAHAQA